MLLESQQSGDSVTLRLSGDWCIENISEVEASVAQELATVFESTLADDAGARTDSMDFGRLPEVAHAR